MIIFLVSSFLRRNHESKRKIKGKYNLIFHYAVQKLNTTTWVSYRCLDERLRNQSKEKHMFFITARLNNQQIQFIDHSGYSKSPNFKIYVIKCNVNKIMLYLSHIYLIYQKDFFSPYPKASAMSGEFFKLLVESVFKVFLS